jgi:hypothetical protein
MQVSGQPHALATLSPEQEALMHIKCETAWATAGLDILEEKFFAPVGIRTLGRPACSVDTVLTTLGVQNLRV